ncbi:MAG: transposase [Acidobacteria bacterium]|nr:transposase [Acidobacteriota bacterium]
MPQSLSAVYVHLVFSTKERFPFLHDLDMRQSTFAYLSGTSKKLDCPTIAVGGMLDQVHVLARFGRTISQADWVKELKRVSNVWLKKQGSQFSKCEWQSGYADFSVSQSNLNRIKKYINEQETHHRKFSFQNEFRTLLRKHQIDFDERYMWD